MPSNPNDTIGLAYATTSTNAIDVSGNSFGSQSSGYSFTPYPTYTYWPQYSWPSENRITALEAEVKVLREMLAAVLSGRDVPKRRAAK